MPGSIRSVSSGIPASGSAMPPCSGQTPWRRSPGRPAGRSGRSPQWRRSGAGAGTASGRGCRIRRTGSWQTPRVRTGSWQAPRVDDLQLAGVVLGRKDGLSARLRRELAWCPTGRDVAEQGTAVAAERLLGADQGETVFPRETEDFGAGNHDLSAVFNERQTDRVLADADPGDESP